MWVLAVTVMRRRKGFVEILHEVSESRADEASGRYGH